MSHWLNFKIFSHVALCLGVPTRFKLLLGFRVCPGLKTYLARLNRLSPQHIIKIWPLLWPWSDLIVLSIIQNSNGVSFQIMPWQIILETIKSVWSHAQQGQSKNFLIHQNVSFSESLFSDHWSFRGLICLSKAWYNWFLGNPRAAVDFTLPIRAQQVSDPVAEEFSLNTTFVLLSKRELWLADSQMQVTETSDVAFPEGLKSNLRIHVINSIFRCSNLRSCPSWPRPITWLRILRTYWKGLPLLGPWRIHSKISTSK